MKLTSAMPDKSQGRAATVAAKRLGFDLDDEPEGLDAGVAFNDKDKREILLGKITLPRE